MGYLVYILRCGDGTLYTGCTNDLPRRLQAHQSGRGAKYTRSSAQKSAARSAFVPVCGGVPGQGGGARRHSADNMQDHFQNVRSRETILSVSLL